VSLLAVSEEFLKTSATTNRKKTTDPTTKYIQKDHPTEVG